MSSKPGRRQVLQAAGVVGVFVAGALVVPLLIPANSNAELIDAVKRNNAAGVRAALKKGANPNARDSSNDSAFARLIGRTAPGHTGASALLLSVLQITQDAPNRTSLMPVWQENAPLVAALLDAGAKPDDGGADPLLGTPLTAAASAHRPETVRLLLVHGANVNASGLGNEPPLLRAANMGDSATVRLLIAHGANIQSRNFIGETALMKAARYSYHPDCVHALLELGADINARDRQGRTALGYAQAMKWAPDAAQPKKRQAIKNEMISILKQAGGKP